ncbi:MAG: metallophosphoesterase [Actinobacteria bacterium]|nr:metallophosphoesterase [Actinomycetota bacterium]
MSATVRIAATGDIHCSEPLREHITEAFATVAEQADLVLIAGDLTTHGEPEEAAVLADACRDLPIPVFAVLGNHDYHANRCEELKHVLAGGGITVLDRSYAIAEVNGREIGIAGAKGFVGGFPGAELPDFGEPLLRQVYRETSDEVAGLESALEAISGCHRQLVLLHYAPIPETLAGEPETIWAFLGSSRLAAPIGAHRPDLVLHGHAHRGTFAGALGPVPIRNVAVHVTGKDFELFEL